MCSLSAIKMARFVIPLFFEESVQYLLVLVDFTWILIMKSKSLCLKCLNLARMVLSVFQSGPRLCTMRSGVFNSVCRQWS